MQTFHGHDYNYDASPYLRAPHQEFRNFMRAGEATRDFTLPKLDGDSLTLSELRGQQSSVL